MQTRFGHQKDCCSRPDSGLKMSGTQIIYIATYLPAGAQYLQTGRCTHPYVEYGWSGD